MPILQHLTVRMDHELAAAVRDLARRGERSTSAEVRRAIRRDLADDTRAAVEPKRAG